MANQLHSHPAWTARIELLSQDKSIATSYERARVLMEAYRKSNPASEFDDLLYWKFCLALTIDDIQHCTPRFWALFSDPICMLDTGAFVVINAHVNLALGTLSRYVKDRPDLKKLADELLRQEMLSIFMLTERGHGLDALNLETTATKTKDGFILNSPREEAAKFMPASTPSYGLRKLAIVMARLIVDNEDRGVRPFVVPICDERGMYKGVESIPLPPRSGTTPFDFSITRFNNVHLPPTALVAASVNDLARPKNPLFDWWDQNWRIRIGTLILASPWQHAIRTLAYIGGRYSMHRCILSRDGKTIPILSFRTQQWSVVEALGVGMVVAAWFPAAVKFHSTPGLNYNVQHAVAVICKTTMTRHFQRCVRDVAERCGAQGTFDHNWMARMENDAKGAIIAEGDVMATCIRLLSELLLSRYTIPLPPPEESLLARHAHALIKENFDRFQSLKCDHRSNTFNNIILPEAENVVEAMGHALAFSAALKARLPKYVLDVYECSVIRRDPAWYTEHAGIDRFSQRLREDAAVSAILPYLPTLLSELDIDKYVPAPIVSDADWKAYLARLPVHSGNAAPNLEQVHARL